jgi:hypothetical protein
MLLAQDGRLGLDDPVSRYLSDAPPAWRGITLRQLLNHTSGLVRDPPEYHPYVAQPPMTVIKDAYALPLASAPGEKFLYSNIGYYVLAETVSRVSGQSWDSYIAEHFFKPAGMAATRLTTADIVPARAGGYVWQDGHYENAEDWIAVRPSGAFLSTISDMAKWEAFQLSPAFPLTAESRKQAVAMARLNGGGESDYGFGWYSDSYLGQTRAHHDGQYPGFRCDYERFGDGTSVIVLANSDARSVERLAVTIAGTFDASLKPPLFQTGVRAPASAMVGAPVPIALVVSDGALPAPGTVTEMEIWDSTGHAVFKAHETNEDFTPFEVRHPSFDWVPQKPGDYTVNVGVYGPKWVMSYDWNQKAASITVH